MIRHFLDLADAGGDAIAAMLADALDRKAARAGWPMGRPDADAPLAGRVLAMIFEKSSTRTRVSFDIAMRQLGGSALVLNSDNTQLGRGETIADTARVLSRMVDAIMLRTDDPAKIEELARHSSVPVMTLIERGKALPGLEVAWLGDGNNVLNSIVEAAGLMRFNVRIAVPEGYDSDAAIIARARQLGARITVLRDPRAAVAGADAVVTDTWVSMGQTGAEARVAAMQPYQVDEALMALASPDAVFLHCLPAHRGEEVTDAVMDGPHSAVWDEAENRIHAQKSVLRWMFGDL
jgi:ornithine carbamoyltransferase